MTLKISGIGNAIVDILCKVDDKFLEDHQLIKGSMSLIDEEIAKKLSALKPEKITCGGSASNTIAALAQLGSKTCFIGKVGVDDFGSKFIQELEKTGAEFFGEKNYDKPSARSFVLITPDAQRTMCTFLGCASEFSEKDISEQALKGSSVLYLEGYLWDREDTISALKKAISLAKKNNIKIAFSLSDAFCVSRHKESFLQLVENDLDILFANEYEALELSSLKEFSPALLSKFFSSNPKLTTIITRSHKGCVVFANDNFFESPAEKISQLVDATGAGDAFAAGFLYGLVNNCDLRESAHLGNILGAKIIQGFGARFKKEELYKIY